MNCFEGLIDDLNTADFDFIEKNFKPLVDLNKTFKLYLERINNVIKEYHETGVVPDLSCVDNWEDAGASVGDRTDGKKSAGKTSLKENIKPPEKTESPPRTGRRTRRNALKETCQTTEKPIRTRRTKKTDILENKVQVKTEKLSIASTLSESEGVEESNNNDEIPSSVVVKSEMPAPTKPAPKKKKKKESKVQPKQEKIEEVVTAEKLSVRDSDVVLDEVNISTVNLVESSDEGEKTITIKKERTTSTKSKQRKRSRTSGSSSDNEGKKDKKRSKSNETTITNKTQYDDAISTIEKTGNSTADATFVAHKSQQDAQNTMNTTVVVENPRLVKNLVPQNVDDLMTDDESDEELKKKKKSPPKPIRAIPKPTKPVFSPFVQSPVKQKVKAFEKLQEVNAATTTRVTRTKTRIMTKEQEGSEEQHDVTDVKSNVKEKAKLFTPATSKFIPKAASTSVKPSRPQSSSTSNESILSAKSASALKASQAEYRERERKRREKEQEALKKKEALIQAQIEEKKRKREEKQLKAQQQRELLEKDKMKTLEVQRLKDERHKRLMAEQEEKKQKLKEETEKKRMMAKLRAVEEKKKEEEKKLEEQRIQKELAAQQAKQDGEMVKMLNNKIQKHTPVYMKTRAPLLPTEDCYDSDDEEAKSRNKYILPQWNKESNLRLMQRCIFAAGEALKNTFFSIQAQTPDLQDIFEVIEPQKLKRSSSAVWHKPPRFTMMPTLGDHDETEEFDEDFD